MQSKYGAGHWGAPLKYHPILPGNSHIKSMFLLLSSFWSEKQVWQKLSKDNTLLFLAASPNLSWCEDPALQREACSCDSQVDPHNVSLPDSLLPPHGDTICTSPSYTKKRRNKAFCSLEALQSTQNTFLVLLWLVRTKLPLVSTSSASTNEIKEEKEVIKELLHLILRWLFPLPPLEKLSNFSVVVCLVGTLCYHTGTHYLTTKLKAHSKLPAAAALCLGFPAPRVQSKTWNQLQKLCSMNDKVHFPNGRLNRPSSLLRTPYCLK